MNATQAMRSAHAERTDAPARPWAPAAVLVGVFAVWLGAAVFVVGLPAAGFRYSPNQLFWLVALPALSGATLRLFLGFADTALGGRRWAWLATAALLLPAAVALLRVHDPATPYELWVALALLCGLGGGSLARAVAPVRGPGPGFGEQAQVLRNRHAWRLAWLNLGSFGGFVGWSVSFPLLAAQLFPPLDVKNAAGLGPLLGLLALALGSRLATQHGAARVSFWAFEALMASAVAAALSVAGADTPARLPMFVAAFAGLFGFSGLAIGSTWRMVPAIFITLHRRKAEPTPAAQERATQAARREAATALGFGSAIGAYGGFFIPKACGTALSLSGSVLPALWAIAVFYLSCVVVTGWHYSRRHAPMPC